MRNIQFASVMIFMFVLCLGVDLTKIGNAQAISQGTSMNFLSSGGTFATNSANRVTGFSVPILVTGTFRGRPAGVETIANGTLNFSTGSLISSIGTPGGFTNTYGAGGFLSIAGTASGGASRTFFTTTFASPSTLFYSANAGGTFTSALTNMRNNFGSQNPSSPRLLRTLFSGVAPHGLVDVLSAGSIRLSLAPSPGTTNSTNFSLGIVSANVILATPEPSTILLLGTGLAGLAVWRYRKNVKV